jgi:hypothetical protein
MKIILETEILKDWKIKIDFKKEIMKIEHFRKRKNKKSN